MQIEHEHHL
jgi:hypothetical protein